MARKKKQVVEEAPMPIQEQQELAEEYTTIEEPTTPIRPRSKLEALCDRISTAVPGVRISRAEDTDTAYIVRRPTGILTLDAAIGGGIPAGGITELWGLENAGKNLLINLLIAQAQRIYGNDTRICFIPNEYDFDKDFARRCGAAIPYSDQEIYQMERERGEVYSEEELEILQKGIGEFFVVQTANGEPALEAICELVASDLPQIIFLDSLALLRPKEEEDKALHEQGMIGTVLPRLLSRWSRKIRASYFEKPNKRPNLVSIVMTNQVMDKIGGMSTMYKTYEIKGGHAIKHSKLLSIKLRKGQAVDEGKGTDKVKSGHYVHWQISKGKAGCADGAEGQFTYYTGIGGIPLGVDRREDGLIALVASGIAIKTGISHYSIPSLDLTVQGKANMMLALDEKIPNWVDYYHKEIMRKNGILYCTRWEERPKR